MRGTATLRRRVTWLTLGPEPFLATCQRCGETVPSPQLPCPLDALVRYLDYALELHASCREPKA